MLRFVMIPMVLSMVIAAAARAQVTMPPIFSDHMVLQADAAAPVWGRASAGQQVRLTFAGHSVETTADATGRWQLTLPPLASGTAGDMTIQAAGHPPRVIADVLVGEVWLCAGQSNMDWYVVRLKEARAQSLEVDFPELRLFKVELEATPVPADHVRGRWIKCTSFKAIRLFSGIGFLFGRDLHRELDVPVGMIQTSWSGSRLMAWTPYETLQAHPDSAAGFLKRGQELGDGPASRAQYQQQVAARKDSGDENQPKIPTLNQWPSRIYNGMVAPLRNYSIRGMLWYQGESDAWGPAPYRELFPAMIASWRNQWQQPDLPFIFVQLPGYGKPVESPPPRSGWAEIRESQQRALDLPNTAMVVTTDLGEVDIHPDNKEAVAQRLFTAALETVYNLPRIHRGPRVEDVTFQGDHVRVTFTNLHGSLRTRDDQPLRGFALAGEDRAWQWAEARIDGAAVVLHAPQVSDPLAVRYDWFDRAQGQLTDDTGLPAAPFRTDTW